MGQFKEGCRQQVRNQMVSIGKNCEDCYFKKKVILLKGNSVLMGKINFLLTFT